MDASLGGHPRMPDRFRTPYSPGYRRAATWDLRSLAASTPVGGTQSHNGRLVVRAGPLDHDQDVVHSVVEQVLPLLCAEVIPRLGDVARSADRPPGPRLPSRPRSRRGSARRVTLPAR